jgi:hypothetical protein
VGELFLVAAGVIVATRRLAPRRAMLCGLALILPGLALLIAAQRLGHFPLLVLATAVCGSAAALGYRGGLAVINRIAPAERKSEVVSAYFVCGFLGNCLPVIGVGVLTRAAGANLAQGVFAAVIAGLAILAFAIGLMRRPA